MKPNNPSQTSLLFSIIIPVFNGEKTIVQCLESVIPHLNNSFECIVVDDGSTDNTISIVKQYPVKLIYNSLKKGQAGARNTGAKAAQGIYLVFLDADVAAGKNTLPLIKKIVRTNPEIQAFIGTYDDKPGEGNFFSQYKNLFHHFTHIHSPSPVSSFWTGCGVISRRAFFEAKGFNVRFRAIEDVEFGYRLTAAGIPIYLFKNIMVTHLKRWDFINLLKTEIFQRALPWSYLFLQQKNIPKELNFSMSDRLSTAITFLNLGLFTAAFKASVFVVIILFTTIFYLMLNRKLLVFFSDKKGKFFALRAMAFHYFYHFYCGACFLIAAIAFYSGIKKNYY